MPHVKDRQPPLAVETETVLREQRVAVEHPDTAAVVRRLGQRITSKYRQSPMEPPCDLDRQRIVPGLRDVADFLDFRELGIRLPALHRTGEPGNRFVPIEHALQTIAVGAEVAELECRRAVELALDVEQILEHVRRLAIGHVAQYVDVRQADQRRCHAAVVRGPHASEGDVEGQIRRQQQRVVTTASG